MAIHPCHLEFFFIVAASKYFYSGSWRGRGESLHGKVPVKVLSTSDNRRKIHLSMNNFHNDFLAYVFKIVTENH